MAPDGEPPLETVRRRAWDQVAAPAVSGAWWALLLFAIFVANDWMTGQPVDHPAAMIAAAVAFVLGFLVAFLNWEGPITIVAGAWWVATTDGAGPVRLYELVRVRTLWLTETDDRKLLLKDRSGAEMVCSLALIAHNPELFALVRNGIRHSDAGGAEIDPQTRAELHLDPGPPP